VRAEARWMGFLPGLEAQKTQTTAGLDDWFAPGAIAAPLEVIFEEWMEMRLSEPVILQDGPAAILNLFLVLFIEV